MIGGQIDRQPGIEFILSDHGRPLARSAHIRREGGNLGEKPACSPLPHRFNRPLISPGRHHVAGGGVKLRGLSSQQQQHEEASRNEQAAPDHHPPSPRPSAARLSRQLVG